MNWKHYRTALLSALDSVGMFDVLTPTEVDAMAAHMAANTSLRYWVDEDEDEVATHLAESGIKTMRDEFAGRAMQAILADVGIVGGLCPTDKDLARYAYNMADAMLEARDETVEKIEEAG